MRKKIEGRTQTPHRQFAGTALPIGVVDPENVSELSARILSRVRDVRNSHGDDCMVFGDPAFRLFIVRVGSAAGTQMLKENAGWLLGLYGGKAWGGGRAKFPAAEQVGEDIREHYHWTARPVVDRWERFEQLQLFAA
ncbi:hypothetical protein FHR47_002291 [Xanthomonas arboricola]|uniref:hypothetical protein n=1 Tax=Xanthomonas cannabis TaxID=1885674 RepID=UPI001622055E|nr:hypothetical protein [Xanthomonas cannabis]MBB3802043.1 hypothetical protein [Xanthomonas cannabis]